MFWSAKQILCQSGFAAKEWVWDGHEKESKFQGWLSGNQFGLQATKDWGRLCYSAAP